VSIDYHRAELKIALDPSHPSHILPPAAPQSYQVLDVGCGAGQTLVAAYPDRISFGIDIDFAALKLGRCLTDQVCFVCGKAENLPYRSGQFDLVVARVSLTYTNIIDSLREIHRVLKKGGTLWMTLHPFSIPWRQAKESNLKGRVFFAYVVLNGVVFHLLQRQFSFRGKYESFQTIWGICRALRKTEFETISITRGKHFEATARSR